ncbi:MAG: hypothetical protein ACKVZ0_17145 [Gemmatimonadales bacterium]
MKRRRVSVDALQQRVQAFLEADFLYYDLVAPPLPFERVDPAPAGPNWKVGILRGWVGTGQQGEALHRALRRAAAEFDVAWEEAP